MTPEQERELAQLMAAAQRGDQPAYAELLARLGTLARRYARTRLGDAPFVDDVVQEILLTVDRVRHTCDTTRPLLPWFYAIASSRLVDAVRRDRRVAAREVGMAELPDAAVVSGSSRDEIDVDAIRAALASLPERHRQIITALKYRDASMKEIASEMGTTVGAVKITAHRGYEMLRKILGGSRRAD